MLYKMLKNTPRKTRQSLLTAALLLCTLALHAQETGQWRAASNTASSITGDIALAPNRLIINFAGFTISRIRDLEKPEITALFDTGNPAAAAASAASLYRLNIPAAAKFLRKNTLCGSSDTQWMVTYASGRDLRIAFFSNPDPPKFTPEAIANSTDLCGTFAYTR